MKSLENFPENFQPLVIVTGDRREVPPQSRGDMLAYSVSNTDFMYLNFLNISDSLVLSDKQFVIDSEETLRQNFGSTNILVIGSPAVNLLARRINDQSVFRFSISEETKMEIEEQNEFMDKFTQFEDDLFIYYQCLEGVLKPENILARFVGLVPELGSLKIKAEQIVREFKKTRICSDLQLYPRPIRYLMRKLGKPGIYDSLAGINRGDAIPLNKDYGMISVLDNPFSEKKGEYSIVFVAGVHGPGTALGLKLLSDNNAFNDHPYGGVYEIIVARFASFFEKFQQSNIRWETPAYKNDKYTTASADLGIRKNIKVFLSSPGGKDDRMQRTFNMNLKNLLKEICKNKGLTLGVEGPYTLAMGGGFDFWDAILKYKKECDFILHDVTDFARGVMVEIGFSFGRKKQYFLIWNLQKSPITNGDITKTPSLLSTINIDRVDLSDLSGSREILRKKVVEKALEDQRDFDCSSCQDMEKRGGRESVFIYAREKSLSSYLEQELSERDFHRIVEDESRKDLRICKICQVLRVSGFALIEISDKDPNSFIVLGMAKAIGIKILPLSLDRYKNMDFQWAKDIVGYQIGSIRERLETPLAKFLNF